MHKAWLAAIAAGTLIATSSVAFAHGHHDGSGSDHSGVAAMVRLAVGSQTSASASDTEDRPELDQDKTGTVAVGTVTAASSGSFSLQEAAPSGTQTVVVKYGSSTPIKPASATIAVGEHVAVRGTMSNGALVAQAIMVAPAPPASKVHPVHGTLSAPVTLTVQTKSGSQTVTLAAGTQVEINPGGLHAETEAAGSTTTANDQGKNNSD